MATKKQHAIGADSTAVPFGSVKLGGTGATVAEFSIDGTLAGNSDTAVPTEQAVKTYVDAKPSGFIWSEEAVDLVGTMGHGYIAAKTSVAPLTITMPTSAATLSLMAIQGMASMGWICQATVGQTIKFGNISTKANGKISSGNRYDALELICTAADTEFEVRTSQGMPDVEIS